MQQRVILWMSNSLRRGIILQKWCVLCVCVKCSYWIKCDEHKPTTDTQCLHTLEITDMLHFIITFCSCADFTLLSVFFYYSFDSICKDYLLWHSYTWPNLFYKQPNIVNVCCGFRLHHCCWCWPVPSPHPQQQLMCYFLLLNAHSPQSCVWVSQRLSDHSEK